MAFIAAVMYGPPVSDQPGAKGTSTHANMSFEIGESSAEIQLTVGDLAEEEDADDGGNDHADHDQHDRLARALALDALA
jgi:hypothetical protein